MKQQKASLLNDLQLASQEISQALAVDPEATVEFRGAEITGPHLQAIVPYMHAQVELIWGGAEQAKQLFLNSLRTFELAEAHFMLGLIYEDEYKSAEALKHFERYLEIDPAGEMSVSAIREANAMRNYRRKFRGNWLLLILLAIFSFGSFLSIFSPQFGMGIVGLILWGGLLTLYWKKKFK